MNDTSPAPSSETEPAEKRPRFLPFAWWVPMATGAVLGLALRLIFSHGGRGDPFEVMSNAYFLFSPFAVGAATVYVAERERRRTWEYHLGAPIVATALYVAGSFAMLIEGIICIIFALPILMAFGALGGLVMGLICRRIDWPKPKYTAYSFIALPLVVGLFPTHEVEHTRIRDVERTLIVAAPPQALWYAINHATAIEPREVEQGWLYRVGVPLPLAGITEETPSGRVRHITMGKSVHFDQVITRWVENEDLVCSYRFTADSFPPGALDDHVRIGGRYFDMVETEYRIERIDARASALKIRMRYRVSTEFNWYADPLARALTANLEETLLNFYGTRALERARTSGEPLFGL
jgi:hypothetical protein